MDNKLVVMFPGQGSQYPGMGKNIFKDNKLNSIIQDASDIINLDLKEMIINDNNKNIFTTSAIVQVAILTISYCNYLLFREKYEVVPSYFIGHSLGEYTALVAAKSLCFKDMVRIVKKRGDLMDIYSKKNPGTMAAVFDIKLDKLEDICRNLSSEKEFVTIANYNSDQEYVIAGHSQLINEASNIIKNKYGGNIARLNVLSACHTKLVKDVALELKKELKKYKFNTPEVPVISSFTTEIYKSNIDEILIKQLYTPVYWNRVIEKLLLDRVTFFIDIGPKSILKNIVNSHFYSKGRNIASEITCFSYNNDKEKIKEKITLSHKAYIKTIMKKIITTKNTNIDSNQDIYYKKIIEPYNKIVKIYEKDYINSNEMKYINTLSFNILEYKNIK